MNNINSVSAYDKSYKRWWTIPYSTNTSGSTSGSSFSTNDIHFNGSLPIYMKAETGEGTFYFTDFHGSSTGTTVQPDATK